MSDYVPEIVAETPAEQPVKIAPNQRKVKTSKPLTPKRQAARDAQAELVKIATMNDGAMGFVLAYQRWEKNLGARIMSRVMSKVVVEVAQAQSENEAIINALPQQD